MWACKIHRNRWTINDQIESIENGKRPSNKTPKKVQHDRLAAVNAEDRKSRHRNAKHDVWSEDFGMWKMMSNVNRQSYNKLRDMSSKAGCEELKEKTTTKQSQQNMTTRMNGWLCASWQTKNSPSKMHRCVLGHRQSGQERCSRKQMQNEPRQEDLGKWEWLKWDPEWNQDAENARTKECMIRSAHEKKWNKMMIHQDHNFAFSKAVETKLMQDGVWCPSTAEKLQGVNEWQQWLIKQQRCQQQQRTQSATNNTELTTN